MKKISIILLVLITFVGFFSPNFTSVAEAHAEEKEQVKELAEALEFIFEDAAVKDQNGDIVFFDIEMIEGKYGDYPGYKDLKSKLEVKNNNNLNKSSEINVVAPRMIIPPTDLTCIQEEMNNWANGFIPSTVIGTIYGYMYDGEYTKAARKLIRSGVKGSVVGVATQLSIVWWRCR